MGLFRRASGSEERSTIDLSRYARMWSESFGAYSPVSVTTSTALTHAATSACIDTLASSVSSLPFDAIRKSGTVRMPISPTPQIISQPSIMVEQDVWLYQLMESMLTDGNAFGEIVSYAGGGLPNGIELIDPSMVTHRRYEQGIPTVTVTGMDRQLWPHGDIWHVPGKFVRAGSVFAESPVTRARATIGAAIAARDFGSQFFADGGHPGGIMTSDQTLTKDEAVALKQSFVNATRGTREPMVIGAGLSYQPIMVQPNDSQFLELLRFSTEETSRFWRVPPAMIYAATSGQSVTYANVTQADYGYLKHSLESYLIRIERSFDRLLPPSQFSRFNRNAFMRSDPETRSVVVDRRLSNKTMTVNEARSLEDELPFADPEYDEPGTPDGSTGDAASVAETIQKVYLGVDKVVTADEAREIVNDAGGHLIGPLPDDTPAVDTTPGDVPNG